MAIAMGHPIRVELLGILGRQIASPSEMATMTGELVGTIAYHVRVLMDLGCAELVRTEPRRGATEHYYRSAPDAILRSSEWRTIPRSLRNEFAAATFDELLVRLGAALKARTFQRRDGATVSCLSVRVDEQGWAEIIEIVGDAEQAIQAAAKSAAKRLGTDPGISVVVAWTSFEAAAEDLE